MRKRLFLLLLLGSAGVPGFAQTDSAPAISLVAAGPTAAALLPAPARPDSARLATVAAVSAVVSPSLPAPTDLTPGSRKFPKNMGRADRLVRGTLAVGAGVLIAAGTVTGVAIVPLAVVGVAFGGTSLVGFCPVYTLFHGSTLSKKHRQEVAAQRGQ